MKKVIMFLLFVVLIAPIVSAQHQRPAMQRSNRWSQSYSQTITWHKKIVTGSDSLYAIGTTDPQICNDKDSLFSDVFYNHGRSNVQFDIQEDTSGVDAFTVYIEVLTANAGDNSVRAIPDSMFKTAYWLKKGTGLAANVVSTSKDSIITIGETGTIQLPLLDAEWFKFLVISSPLQTDRNVVKGYLNRQER
jgi:hypothetical protein